MGKHVESRWEFCVCSRSRTVEQDGCLLSRGGEPRLKDKVPTSCNADLDLLAPRVAVCHRPTEFGSLISLDGPKARLLSTLITMFLSPIHHNDGDDPTGQRCNHSSADSVPIIKCLFLLRPFSNMPPKQRRSYRLTLLFLPLKYTSHKKMAKS